MTGLHHKAGRRGPPTWAPVLALLILLLAVHARAAGSRVYVLDPARSQVRFFAASRLMNAEGVFARVSGEIQLDDARPESASGRVTIEVGSLDTGIRMRDNHLRSSDFLDAARHPQATFVSAAVRRDADRWAVQGRLTIRGVTRPVGAPVTVTASEGTIRIVGQLTVNRRDFGVAYDSFLNPIQDEVRVSFDLTARAR